MMPGTLESGKYTASAWETGPYVALVSALGLSLLLTMAILTRILWVTVRSAARSTRAR